MTLRPRPVASGALLVYLLTGGMAALAGQHAPASAAPEHKAPAAAKSADTPSGTAAPAPDTKTSAHVASEATAPAKSAAAGPSKPPNMKAIVERIQHRIDEEVLKPAASRAANPPRKPVAHASTGAQPIVVPDRRIRLSWRVSLIWPAELVAAK